MKHYVGECTPDGCDVMVLDVQHEDGGYMLPPRNDLMNHSPDGFNWGYGGSGPAQLALAILADALGDDRQALRHYQSFKRKVIAPMDGERFSLSEEDVRTAVVEVAAERVR